MSLQAYRYEWNYSRFNGSNSGRHRFQRKPQIPNRTLIAEGLAEMSDPVIETRNDIDDYVAWTTRFETDCFFVEDDPYFEDWTDARAYRETQALDNDDRDDEFDGDFLGGDFLEDLRHRELERQAARQPHQWY